MAVTPLKVGTEKPHSPDEPSSSRMPRLQERQGGASLRARAGHPLALFVPSSVSDYWPLRPKGEQEARAPMDASGLSGLAPSGFELDTGESKQSGVPCDSCSRW